MNTSALIWTSACVGLGSVLFGWGHYIATIPRDTVPRTPLVMFITQAAGIFFASASLVLGNRADSLPVAVMIIAGLAIFMALFFFILFSQRNTPLGKIQVKVGSPMLGFESLDSAGISVASDDWRGRRILFKFFRGFW